MMAAPYTSSMKKLLPVLFVPHGSPMFAIEPGPVGTAMVEVVQRLARPRAVVIVSPHWETADPVVGVAPRLSTVHDFYGFDSRLYEIQYPATGCPEAAEEVVLALRAAGFSVSTDAARGLDHGAWVPLRQVFPDADVPVIPLSMQAQKGPEHAYRVGQALSALARQNFLVMGSGNITHNLYDWQLARRNGEGPPSYVREFSDWIFETLRLGRIEALMRYRTESPIAVRAHPSEEHLLPLFTALGAAGPEARAEPFYRGVSETVLAMDGYAFSA
jgi:4,5-DOPA dioxygenase extradiol